MDEMNLKEMTANLAVKAYNDIDAGNGNFDENIKLLREATNLTQELENAELDNEVKDITKRKILAETDKADNEVAKLIAETEKIEAETKHQKADKYWDRALRVASIVVPVASTAVTGIIGYLVFKEKCHFTSNTIKLNTILEEKGYISGLNNSKMIQSTFNELMKK